MIPYILGAEASFWVLLLAALFTRYLLRLRRASTALLCGLPLVDLALLSFVTIDLARGSEPTQSHALAASYLGFTLAFGHPMVRLPLQRSCSPVETHQRESIVRPRIVGRVASGGVRRGGGGRHLDRSGSRRMRRVGAQHARRRGAQPVLGPDRDARHGHGHLVPGWARLCSACRRSRMTASPVGNVTPTLRGAMRGHAYLRWPAGESIPKKGDRQWLLRY